jgi:hypothetical protein
MFLAVQEILRSADPDAAIGGNDGRAHVDPGPILDETPSYLMWAASGRHERSGFPSEPGQMDGPALRDFASKV